ncbi:hypothetical protein BCR36DRAFT_22831 [Piromyces finnis]|uniref:Right handed beta helix domain-containing protein n=1 Tax=Piromyces finnis TaxID=1754191 RepID=A0A1Y1UNP6_9FUNG|nr:hypothetical protein BCR36DRAFT_22831 [Piromyces finnis]|eukprot:ORX38755.1 hypothetical protein BCR36DRAFT_22831 [Piromyces finnis]
MTRIIFNGLTKSADNCLNLHGNVKIDNSKFYGNSLCDNSIIYYDGGNINNITVSDSYFNGVYSNNCINMINGNFSKINSSTFENCSGYISGIDRGGGALRLDGISLNMNNCVFRNIFTPFYGGVFNIFNALNFDVEGIEVYNTTAVLNGGLILADSALEDQVTYTMKNVKYFGNDLNHPIEGGDSIASVVGYIQFNMTEFYGEDFYVNNDYALFTMNIDSSISLKNIKINRVNGVFCSALLFFNSYSEGLIKQTFEIINGTFVDFTYQETSAQLTAIIGTNNIIEIILSECTFKNFNVFNSEFMYNSQENNVTMSNVIIDGYHSKRLTNFIENSGYYEPRKYFKLLVIIIVMIKT